ncbi:CBO0543 family protein [Paenibacillus alvei]
MDFEGYILIVFFIICIVTLVKFVPKKKRRDACVVFLFIQVIVLPVGLIAVQLGLIEYSNLLQINGVVNPTFSFEFIFFPITATLFSLYIPSGRDLWHSLFYYIAFSSFFTIVEVVLENKTKLIVYHEWKWYWTFFLVILFLFINQKFYNWFKKRLVTVSNN